MKLSISLLLLACVSAAQATDNALTLGAGLAAGPRYSGSREMQVAPIIAIDYQLSNGLYASTMRGLGYGTAIGPLSLELALGMRAERSDEDKDGPGGIGGSRGSDELRGMGKVKASGTANLRAGYEVLPGLSLAAHASLPVTHRENGKTGGIELTGVLHASEDDNVTLSLGANFADRKYAQTYYGVNRVQAARTGRAIHTPRAGLYEALFNFTWEHRFGKHWSATGMLGSSTLLRDAANSPVTHRSTSPTGAFFASYRY